MRYKCSNCGQEFEPEYEELTPIIRCPVCNKIVEKKTENEDN